MGVKATVNEKIVSELKKLSDKHRKEVSNFVAYLRAKEELSATKEILKDEDFLKSIMKGDEDFTKGRFKRWSEVKENV